MIELLKKDK
jgi:ribonuclease HI